MMQSSNSREGSAPYDDDDDFGAGDAKKPGIGFYINKNGLPLDNITWERMWDHVSGVHPDGQRIQYSIRHERYLPEVAVPHAPICFPPGSSTQQKIEAVQAYLQALQYNHTGTQFFDIKKGRPLCGLMECAKLMIREALPIKCLEAVILGLHLTNCLQSVDRFPISFRSTFRGNIYRHVVLGLHANGRYGALGLSRREDLMYKPLQYTQLSAMVADFQHAYKKYWHNLDRLKIGLAVSHDPHTYECVKWKALYLNLKKLSHVETCRQLDKFSKEIRKQTNRCPASASAYATPAEKAQYLQQFRKPVSMKKACSQPPAIDSAMPLPLRTLPEVSAAVCRERTSSSLLSAKLSEADLAYSVAPQLSCLSSRTQTQLYDIRI